MIPLKERSLAASARRPWSPIPLVLVTLVGGLPGAGALLAINWYRLGRPDLGRATGIAFALLTLIGAGFIGWFHQRGVVGEITPESIGAGGGIVMGWYLTQIAIALLVAIRQRPLFERFLAESSQQEAVGAAMLESVVAMAAAAVGGVFVHQAIIRLAVRVFGG